MAARRIGRMPPRMLYWLGLIAAVTAAIAWMTWMPGNGAGGQPPAPTAAQRALAARLESDVRALAEGIGERNHRTDGTMERTARWIESRFREVEYEPRVQRYELSGESLPGLAGISADNVVAELPGTDRPGEIVIVGAHYDSVTGSPGANDNASGVAALIALAGSFRDRPRRRTLRFVAFANEEVPYFLGPDMGSHAYARHCAARNERVVAMMSMDGIGYFTEEPGSQHYPVPGIGLVYPDRGNFIGFVTRVRDARLLRRALRAFREHADMPSEGAALPGGVAGVGWSDHWSFWQHGYPAFLVTDTLPFRYPHYHAPGDTPDRLDYGRMARVVAGLEAVIEALAGAE